MSDKRDFTQSDVPAKRSSGLFLKIVIAIAVGVGLGFVAMHTGAVGHVGVRILKTFNVLFAQVLKFIVPLLILGLVTPAIANAGKGAGKMLLFVMLFSYFSTCAAALFSYFCSGQLLPLYVLGLTLAHMLVEVADRYHYSLIPILVIFAALGFVGEERRLS